MSGQCLSASEAGRALTPATHHRLGGLLHRQLANGAWAHPGAVNLWSVNIIEYYRQFPDAILDPRADSHVVLSLSPLSCIATFSRDSHA